MGKNKDIGLKFLVAKKLDKYLTHVNNGHEWNYSFDFPEPEKGFQLLTQTGYVFQADKNEAKIIFAALGKIISRDVNDLLMQIRDMLLAEAHEGRDELMEALSRQLEELKVVDGS